MFGFRGYMAHAFPHDDLRPLSCRGHDTQGGFGNTLVDVLDTLVVRPTQLKA
jgi:Glycosyl hydrolase family 47